MLAEPMLEFELERVFEFMFEAEFIFEVEFMFEAAGVLAIVGAGVGVARFAFALLLAELFDAASPHAIPSAPSVRTVASAIFFISLIDLLSSSKS